MKIYLNNIQSSNSIFQADLFINNELSGYVWNKKDGSATTYCFLKKEDEIKLESYCDTLPKEIVHLSETKYIEIKMNIEKLINNLIEQIKD